MAVGHCGAFWTCKSAAVVKAAPVLAKRSLQNLIFGGVKHWPWTPIRSSPVALKIEVKQCLTLIHLRHAKTFLCERERMYIVLNHLET